MWRITCIVLIALLVVPCTSTADSIDVLIKGVDDGIRSNKQQDCKEAVMNAKLGAIERAGVEISSITKVVNFKLKYDMIESKAKAILLPGFQVMDMGYQQDGTYQVVLSGKIQIGDKEQDAKLTIIVNRYRDMRRIGDTISFDVVERGGGITNYKWEIFPEKLIESNKKHFMDRTFGIMQILYEPGHHITGIDDINIMKAKTALFEGKSVSALPNGPISTTLIVPPGKYYIDYAIIINREVHKHRKYAPMQYFRNSSSVNNWGPYIFTVKPGEHKEIVVTPNGYSLTKQDDSLNPFLSYIMLEHRDSYLREN